MVCNSTADTISIISAYSTSTVKSFEWENFNSFHKFWLNHEYHFKPLYSLCPC